MRGDFDTSFRRFLRCPASERERRAHALLDRETEWPAWVGVFNEVHVTAPEREAIAAASLAAVAARRRQRELAARFRLLEARGRHRADSPRAAASAFGRASRSLRSVGDEVRALQADVLCVDALALAGRPGDALALAERTAPKLRGAARAPWRAALRVNRANALRLAGDLDAAVRAYQAAARAFERLGDEHSAAIARTNAGVSLVDAGEPVRARGFFEAALDAFEKADQTDMALEVRYNLAGARVRSGDVGEGIAQLEALEAEHRRRGLDRRLALVRMDLADAFLRAGDAAAAEARALAAADVFRRAGAAAERVEALWVAALAASRRDLRRAQSHVRRAARAARSAGRPAYELWCELLDLDLDAHAGKPAKAPAWNRLAARALALGQKDLARQVRLAQAYAALARGRPHDALRLVSAVGRHSAGKPWIRAAVETVRARAEARLGRTASALTRLRRVTQFLDAVRADLPGAWLRATFSFAHLDPYVARIELLLERGRSADRREAEALLDGLAARRFLEARPAPRASGEMAALRRKLDAIYDRLARSSGPTRGLDPRDAVALEREARKLEHKAAERWRTHERRHGSDRDAPHGAPESGLSRGVTGVHLWVREDRVRGLVRRGDAVTPPVDLGSTKAWQGQAELLTFLDDRALRRASAAPALENELARVARRLLVPLGVEDWSRHVRLVLDPQLVDLPFEVLPWRGRPLAAHCRLLRVPSLRVRVRRARMGEDTTVVALGDRDLPGSLREALRVARDEGVVLRAGDEATRCVLAEALARSRCVHVTGHGFDAPAAPGLGGIRVADGWFAVPDLPERVAAELVILAACRSGLSTGLEGMAWAGLPSALLASGARRVLWTAGDVDDDVTADLMVAFHEYRSSMSAEAALGRALETLTKSRGSSKGLLEFRMSGTAR